MPRHNSSTNFRGHGRRNKQRRHSHGHGPLATYTGDCYAAAKPKHKYQTERDAWEAISANPYLKTYRCPACQCWHTARLRTRDLNAVS